ncbi:MAG TPA: response regulator [Candidatus Glassbacteria bacterium]|nr:response regulator [Candidatus Glassbacteria bacterium]
MEFERIKILIVDDETALRIGLSHCLKKAGYLTLEAQDGPTALELVRRQRPALVILDVMMRGMTGIEVCRKLRDDEETREIKILFLSARGQTHEQSEGLEAGGDYYMTKPFEYRKLLKVIEDLLENRKETG